MPAIVLLEDVVEALEMSSERLESFLDAESGEIVSVTEDERFDIEESDLSGMPEWEREHLERVRRITRSEHVLRLPDTSDIHEWSIMEKFCTTVTDVRAREELLESIHGKGAFHRFREGLERFGIRDEWFAYRQTTLEQIARDWLDSHSIPYSDDRRNPDSSIGGLTRRSPKGSFGQADRRSDSTC